VSRVVSGAIKKEMRKEEQAPEGFLVERDGERLVLEGAFFMCFGTITVGICPTTTSDSDSDASISPPYSSSHGIATLSLSLGRTEEAPPLCATGRGGKGN
jgi:hypothetical protein